MSTGDQPKWAWWVVGIVIPIIGVLVAVWAIYRPTAPGGTATSHNTRPPLAAEAEPPAADPIAPQVPRTVEAPARVRASRVDITLEPGLNHLDLDAGPPIAMPSGQSADLIALFDVRDPGLVTEGSTPTLARLPTNGRDPTAAECAAVVEKSGSHEAGAPVVGARFCLKTDEGHVAYLRITLGVPIEPHLRLQATVWE